MSRFVVNSFESFMLVRQNENPPSDEEWNAALRLLGRVLDEQENVKMLVASDGGGPTAAQRNGLRGVLRGRTVRVAVVSKSAKLRFIVSSLALLNPEIRTFLPNEVAEAYGHLLLSASERRAAERMLRDAGFI